MSLEEAVNECLDALRRTEYIDDFLLRGEGPLQRAFVKYLSKAPKEEIGKWMRAFNEGVRDYEEKLRREAKFKLERVTGAQVLLWPERRKRVKKEDRRVKYASPSEYYLTFLWDLKGSSDPFFTVDGIMRGARWYVGGLENLDLLVKDVEGDPSSEIKVIYPSNFKGRSYKLVDKEKKVEVMNVTVGEMGRKSILKLKIHLRFLKENKERIIDMLDYISSVGKKNRKNILEKIVDRIKGE